MPGRRAPELTDMVEVFCWCGRWKMTAPMSNIRHGIPSYCGPRCSTLPPMSLSDVPKKRGRSRKNVSPEHDQYGNRIKPRIDI